MRTHREGEERLMDKKLLLQRLFFFKTIFACFLYRASGQAELIDRDVERYLDEIPFQKAGMAAFRYCMLYYKPFRNVFYYRTEKNHILRVFCRILLPPVEAVEIIGGEIGPGLRVDHNFCVIRPYKAGKNLTVRNGVTIGKGKAKEEGGPVQPVLGDDVDIYANAVIFGGIHIGNDVKIGAGTVVNKDVPDHCTVVGNPMRIISHEKDMEKI